MRPVSTVHAQAMEDLDTQVLRTALGWQAAGLPVVLVTVARTWGSSPRPPGSLMAINGRGETVGRYACQVSVRPNPTMIVGASDSKSAFPGLDIAENKIALPYPVCDSSIYNNRIKRDLWRPRKYLGPNKISYWAQPELGAESLVFNFKRVVFMHNRAKSLNF